MPFTRIITTKLGKHNIARLQGVVVTSKEKIAEITSSLGKNATEKQIEQALIEDQDDFLFACGISFEEKN